MTERERRSKSSDAPQEDIQDSSQARGEEVADKIDDLLDETIRFSRRMLRSSSRTTFRRVASD